MASRRDFYEVLGVARGATQAEIRTAYRRLAREYHPDLNKNDGAEDRFKEINEAYEVLSNDERRRRYDRFGHAGLGGAASGGGFDGGLGEIFEQFFGGFARNAPRRSGPQPGNDLRTSVEISFEDAVHGTTVELDVDRLQNCRSCSGSGAAPGTMPIRCSQCGGLGEVRTARQSIFGQVVVTDTCPRCGGDGEVIATPCATCNGKRRIKEERRLEVNVPPGIDDGMRIRLANEGDEGHRGGPPGSLFVDVRVRPHDYFRRDGQTILLDLELNIAQAALGDQIEVPTVDGMHSMSIPAGTQTGQTFRLRGRGVPHVRNEGLRGDMIVSVYVRVPTDLNAEQRELIEALGTTLGSNVKPQAHRGGFFDRLRDAFK